MRRYLPPASPPNRWVTEGDSPRGSHVSTLGWPWRPDGPCPETQRLVLGPRSGHRRNGGVQKDKRSAVLCGIVCHRHTGNACHQEVGPKKQVTEPSR